MLRKLLMISTVSIALLAPLAVACGGDDDKSSSSNSTAGRSPDVAPTAASASTAPSSSASSAPAVQKIALNSGEKGQAYFFSQTEIKLKPGPVEVTLTNDGPERPHNFVVKKLDGSGDLASMDRLNPGQSNTVTFTVAAGTYQFICSLPGHADRGAKGTLVVAN